MAKAAVAARLLACVLLAAALACTAQGGTSPTSPSSVTSPLASIGVSSIAICHRDSGAQAFARINVPRSELAKHLAHGDSRVGVGIPAQPGMKFGPDCVAAATVPITIQFNGVPPNEPPFIRLEESGFKLMPRGGKWKSVRTFGAPLPSIQFERTNLDPTLGGAIEVTSSESLFSLSSVDLVSSLTSIPYLITGRLDGAPVFKLVGEVPHTDGFFKRVNNPSPFDTIDTLIIELKNPLLPCCGNQVGLDNIALRR